MTTQTEGSEVAALLERADETIGSHESVGSARFIHQLADAIRRLTATLAERDREVAELREALWELVACKDFKERAEGLERETSRESSCLRNDYLREYERRKPIAWKAARAALRAKDKK